MSNTEVMTAAQYHSRFHGKGKRVKPQQRESELQAECVAWFRMEYHGSVYPLFSVPNGGHRNKVTAARMKKEGQLPGIPDLMLAAARKGYHGLFIELKVKGNKLTELQEAMIERLRLMMYKVEVVYSLEQFQELVNEYIQCQP